MEESRTSPRLIGISSPKTWDEWIKKEPQAVEAAVAAAEKEEIVVEVIEVASHAEEKTATTEEHLGQSEEEPVLEKEDEVEAELPLVLEDNQLTVPVDNPQTVPVEQQLLQPAEQPSLNTQLSLNTILEEDEDSSSKQPQPVLKNSTIKIKLDSSEESPKVVIKSTRFKVIPAEDVWEPKQAEGEVVVGDPMTMIESHLNQLTMVESQLKKLKGGSEVLKMRPLKLDLDEHNKSESKSKLGWLSIFKKKAVTPPPQPSQQPQPPPTGVVTKKQLAVAARSSAKTNYTYSSTTRPQQVAKRHQNFGAAPTPRIIVQVPPSTVLSHVDK